VALSGTGVATVYTVLPTSVAFGSEQTNVRSAAMLVTVTNTGNAPLLITSIALSGQDPRLFSQINTCRSSVAVGAACTISVVFKPTSTGSKTATLSVNGGAGTQSVALSGTGVAPSYTVLPTSVAFGSQLHGTTSAAQSVTVMNSGNGPLPITSITLSGQNLHQFSQTNNCGSAVAVGAACTISVVFKPTLKGSMTATLSVNGGGGAATQSIALSGTGT
jgi:predicted acylesterase/phospholipase RssA